MLVIIRHGHETPEGQSGLKAARDLAADIILTDDGVMFAFDDNLDGFCGTAYIVREDLERLGIATTSLKRGVKVVSRDSSLELMSRDEIFETGTAFP